LKISYRILLISLIVLLSCNSTFAVDKSTDIKSSAEKVAVQKNMVLGLNDCLNIALQNSPEVKKYRYKYAISKNDVGIAKSAYFPTLGIGAGYNYNGENSTLYTMNDTTLDAEASINQLIWDFGKTHANIKMYKFNQIAAKYNFDNAVLNTVYAVEINYFGVLAARTNVDVERANVQVNERNYQRIKAYFDEGIKSKIDLVNAEVNLSDAKIQLVTAEQTYQNAIVKLNNSMYIAYAPAYEIKNTEAFNFSKNFTPVSLQRISETKDISKLPKDVGNAYLTVGVQKLDVLENYKFKPFPYTFDESVDLAKKNRPDLKSYEAVKNAMDEELLVIKRQYYPKISASAGYGYKDKYSASSYNAGVNLTSSVNIMQEKNEIDTGKLQIALAKNDIDQLEQNIYFDIQTLYINMKQLEKQIPLVNVKVKQTLENFELADGRYAVGLGDYIELQDAKVKYNNAQQSYVNTVYNYNVARANLEKAIGLQQAVTANIEDKK
jgi:outer membrane protein